MAEKIECYDCKTDYSSSFYKVNRNGKAYIICDNCEEFMCDICFNTDAETGLFNACEYCNNRINYNCCIRVIWCQTTEAVCCNCLDNIDYEIDCSLCGKDFRTEIENYSKGKHVLLDDARLCENCKNK